MLTASIAAVLLLMLVVLTVRFTGIKRVLQQREAELESSKEEVRRSHKELERRVGERTESMVQAVLALEKAKERYALAVEASNDGIWDCDLQTGKVFLSPRWKSMLGYGDDDIQDTSKEFWKGLIHPADYQRTMDAFNDYLEGRIPEYELEYRLRQKDGSYRWILTRGACCRDSEGKPYRMAGSHTDISRRKLAEQALAQESARTIRALEALREKEQMLLHQSRQAAMGEMIGNIAHQWRQPLNTLGLLIQQAPLFFDLGELDREFLAENTQKSMEIIQHMSKTIDDFRNYFQPDKARVEFKVHDVITSTLSMMEGSFKSHQIAVETVVQDDLVLHGFPNEFSQVLLNILNNAKDVVSERKVRNPKVAVVLCRENDNSVVTITDNAGGIPENIIGKIFDPYFTTKGPQYGTGVGLFMSKTIIEKNMGGRLTARNRDGGAEFRIEL
ncbi:PAS domain-containing protein [Geobacter sp. SVR]|uniref:PAS domain-containing sensor histidine kinase n=1 Tax=Geobacter sp. SVR TaxID=2495594 RepID=UPI00143EFE0C|nr:PAS domain-containing protein [Geobacter sp. SVR]BCS55287.1 hypothetical protein GSVR_35950 [Geobacter sp. SVR]GCF86086.1 hypothetical protein GSbR_26860 [Geobacter sp. SVR]